MMEENAVQQALGMKKGYDWRRLNMKMELSYWIIEVLKKHASEKKENGRHPLNQKEILDYLNKDNPHFPEPVTEKSLRFSLEEMRRQEYHLPDNQKTLRFRKKSNRIMGYWTANSISDAELKFLIDSVMYGNILNTKKAQSLAKRIQGLSGKSLYRMTPYTSGAYGKQKYLPEIDVLGNVDSVMQAKMSGLKIQFMLNVYTVKEGEIVLEPTREYTVSPLEMVLNNGRYYMIAATDDTDKLKYYRLDLMTNIILLKDRARKPEEFNELKGFRRDDFMLKHPFMYGGQERKFWLKIKKDSFTQAVDAFSDSLRYISGAEEDDTITVTVEASEEAMKLWLLQYGDIAQAVDMNPAFAEKLKKSIEILKKNYE